MGGGIEASGGAICWVSFTWHVLCKDTPGGGTQTGKYSAKGGIGGFVLASSFPPSIDDVEQTLQLSAY